MNGQVQVKGVSLQLGSWPTGIANANGVIQLNGTDARIVSLTAESGGGKITATGFAAYTGSEITLDLKANARGVRARYSGASISANATVSLTGTSRRSVLAGTVTITRVGYSQQSDIGSILTASSTPPQVPSAPTGITAGMRLNVRIQTAPDVIFQTSMAEQLSANADMTLEGTAASPGMVGRVNVTGGTLIFFGNKYTVNRGSISFYNPLSIDPVLDIDLETYAQGVQVDIGVSGPIEDLKLTYRSDPPLRFEDIVALLAAGKTPPDPTIAVNQPASPDQTATQMGESALLGAAVANPVASRLARVFGVSQLSIAPTFVTGSALPQTRVTVQQQVNSSVTFTYSQDVSQPNSQLIRIEVELTPRFSAVATRDENGILGVDFYYKRQFK
jgi:translocation and assembly module TamB